ncbi:heme peroxidase [Cynara cardunculus var. scolymus]|uniref:Peroxidase n=1 Tax=Cynara cardunculus var. scolymus TaxID=59895 RepID=A0A103Y7Y5_CYNCS|nr:heme peroxidase [Cynara cardunculus var. scolymus]
MAYIPSLVLQLLLLALVFAIANGSDLKLGFYRKACPRAEAIVEKATADHVSVAPSLAAPLLRMHFHDCFVRIANISEIELILYDVLQGCDGSVLIDSTKDNRAEKDGPPNLSLRGYQVIDAAKTVLETECPGVVSCADILALVARDAIYQNSVYISSSFQIKGPYWAVPLGRRDGRVSIASESLTLPAPFDDITRLKEQFSAKGLRGHTIGTSHCSTIAARLYNFTGKGDTDPSLDSDYVPYLKSKCKPTDRTTLLEMDPGSFRSFDKNYYKNVLKRRGLFQSDAALLADKETSAYVKLQAESNGHTFLKDFEESIMKMGQIGVLTGEAGEIRRHCARIN